MAEPLRPRVPLAARMHHRGGGAGAAGSARAAPRPHWHPPAAPGGGSMVSPAGPCPCPPGRAAPCRGGLAGSRPPAPAARFAPVLCLKKGVFREGCGGGLSSTGSGFRRRRVRRAGGRAPAPLSPALLHDGKSVSVFTLRVFVCLFFVFQGVCVCLSNTFITELNTQYFQVLILQPVFPPPVPGSSACNTKSALSSQGPKRRLHLCHLVCVYVHCGGPE